MISKIPRKLFPGFLPWNFFTFLGASWKLFGASLFMILLSPQEARKASRKPPGNYKKIQGRNPYKIFVAILVEMMTPKRHFEINWPVGSLDNPVTALVGQKGTIHVLRFFSTLTSFFGGAILYRLKKLPLAVRNLKTSL